MAYLMSDVAAGSQAALQLQQNMAAAPYVEREAALKFQQDQIKVQQDQANLERTKLSNLVTDANIKVTEDTRTSLQALKGNPDFQKALANNDYAAVLRMTGATQMQAGDVVSGAQTMAQSDVFEAKQVAANQKKLDLQAQTIGNAYGVIEAIPDDKVNEYVDRLPEEQKNALISQIGRENWDKMDGKQKKEATKNLMMNAKGQLAQQKINADLEKTRLLNASRERIQMLRDIAAMERKQVPTPEKESALFNAYERKETSIQSRYKKPLEEADKEVSTAENEVNKGRLFGMMGASDATVKTLEAATKKRDDIRRKILKESRVAAEELPDGPFKNRVMKQLDQQADLLSEEEGPEVITGDSSGKEPKPIPLDGAPKETPADISNKQQIAQVKDRAKKDPAMKGNKFGTYITGRGLEVFKDGKLIGYYK